MKRTTGPKHDPVKARERRLRREQRRMTEGPRPEDTAREARRKAAQRPKSRGRLRGTCFCGCGGRAAHRHHVIYEAELRRVVFAGRSAKRSLPPGDLAWLTALVNDPRNLVAAAFDCHGAHHLGSRRYQLEALPDSVFAFAAEVLGVRAHGWLRRRYAGEDPRLDALLLEVAA